MMVHSLEASPRVGRAFDRGIFELFSSVRRCMARLCCCAASVSNVTKLLTPVGRLTSCAHVPFFGHVDILLHSYAQLGIV